MSGLIVMHVFCVARPRRVSRCCVVALLNDRAAGFRVLPFPFSPCSILIERAVSREHKPNQSRKTGRTQETSGAVV